MFNLVFCVKQWLTRVSYVTLLHDIHGAVYQQLVFYVLEFNVILGKLQEDFQPR